MVLVDSSVWINFLLGRDSPATQRLSSLMQQGNVVVGDLIVAEVMQGARSKREWHRTRALMSLYPCISLVNEEIAYASASNYRRLRSLGTTVRKTIDVLIATSCIQRDLPLLFEDRDFLPCVKHLGLKAAQGRE